MAVSTVDQCLDKVDFNDNIVTETFHDLPDLIELCTTIGMHSENLIIVESTLSGNDCNNTINVQLPVIVNNLETTENLNSDNTTITDNIKRRVKADKDSWKLV